MAKIDLLVKIYSISKSPAPGLCLHFWLLFFPGFHNTQEGEKKLPTAHTFFGGGYILNENCFETLKGSTIE